MFYFHYGERQHIDKFFEDGSIQIGTLRSYDTEAYGNMVGDDQEGLSFCDIDANKFHDFSSQSKQFSPDISAMFGQGCFGSIVRHTSESFNYAIFCVSRILHKNLCRDFSPKYDSAIIIERPFPFFAELTKSFEESRLAESVVFQHVEDIEYRSNRYTEDPFDLVECFIKPENYQHQAETRAIWNAGKDPQRFFRFKAPQAVRCCKRILIEDMPDYEPGSDASVFLPA